MASPTIDGLHGAIAACRVRAPYLRDLALSFSLARRRGSSLSGRPPGARVHASGIAWDDASGERLRIWTGIDPVRFYDPASIAFVPMGFCCPGTGASGDLPPRPECAPLWHDRILAMLPRDRLVLLVGTNAQARYFAGPKGVSLTERRAGCKKPLVRSECASRSEGCATIVR